MACISALPTKTVFQLDAVPTVVIPHDHKLGARFSPSPKNLWDMALKVVLSFVMDTEEVLDRLEARKQPR